MRGHEGVCAPCSPGPVLCQALVPPFTGDAEGHDVGGHGGHGGW